MREDQDEVVLMLSLARSVNSPISTMQNNSLGESSRGHYAVITEINSDGETTFEEEYEEDHYTSAQDTQRREIYECTQHAFLEFLEEKHEVRLSTALHGPDEVEELDDFIEYIHA